MNVEVRALEPAEYAVAVEVISTGFLERPDVAKVGETMRDFWEPGRMLVAFDGPRACGTFRSWATELTVPGGARLPAAAVSAVTVLPTHRRRGVLTAMAAAAHAAMRERGETVGLLYTSEYPIYGRFGYAPGTRSIGWTIASREARLRGTSPGGVELVTPDAAVKTTVAAIHDAWRRRQPGEIRRRDISWQVNLGLRPEPWGETWKGFLALRRDAAGEVDGYARYRAEPKWDDHGSQATLDVAELHALTTEAYAALWRFLLEIDLVASVRAEGRPPREPLPWLLGNARAAQGSVRGDSLWVRLFDVPGALEARTYERSGALVIEVVDDEAWGGRRRLLLDAGPDGATCRPTDRAPDLTLPVAAIGGAYLGGTRLRDIALATGADEHRAGALAEADALLRTADEPWCSTFF